MASRIVQYFADKLKTVKEYPITLTKAVYDENGKRLDNKLQEIDNSISDVNSNLETKVIWTTTNIKISDIASLDTSIKMPEKPDETNYTWYLMGVALFNNHRYMLSINYIDNIRGEFSITNKTSSNISAFDVSLRWLGIHK